MAKGGKDDGKGATVQAGASPAGASPADPSPAADLGEVKERHPEEPVDPAIFRERGRVALGIDIGGSGIKAAVVDVRDGKLVSTRVRIATPSPATPDAVIASVGRVVARLKRLIGVADLPIGVDFPAVILDGRTMSAANVDPGWVKYPAREHLERTLGGAVALINDADAAGLAEMRFGAGAGHDGVVLVLTLGTGTGSALFYQGMLVPNLELGHMEIRGRDAERRSAASARIRRGLSWKAWATDLEEHLQAIDKLFWPDLLIVGGGVSKNADKFLPRISIRPQIVPAKLRNEAGIIGAAMYAAELAAGGRAIDARGRPAIDVDAPGRT